MGPCPLQLLLTVEVSSRGVGIGHPRSVSWDRSGTTLALGTVGNAVCLVQPGEVGSKSIGAKRLLETLQYRANHKQLLLTTNVCNMREPSAE